MVKRAEARGPNELGALWLAQAEGDAGFGEVVGGQFEFDAVTDGQADEMFAHFSGDVREDFMLVDVEGDTKHRSRQNGFDGPFHFNSSFSAHIEIISKRPRSWKDRGREIYR
jgi:hypothetical protein